MLGKLLVGAIVGACGFVGYYGTLGRDETRAPVTIHEDMTLAFLRAHREYMHETNGIDWKVPYQVPDQGVMQHDMGNLFFDLTIDKFTSSVTNHAVSGSGEAVPEKLDDPVLFVSAPSFVASRTSFLPIASTLFSSFAVTDPPTYGDNTQQLRPEHYCSKMFQSALRAEVKVASQAFGTERVTVAAAGHSAITLLQIAQESPELFDKIILINPTFRGPLPTAEYDLANGIDTYASSTASAPGVTSAPATPAEPKPLAASFVSTLRSALWELHKLPFVGEALHYLSTSERNIENQLRSHVFVNETSYTQETLDKFVQFAKQGPFLGKAAFLVGRADPMAGREELQALIAGGVKVPTLVLMGEHSPVTSMQDMAALQSQAQNDKNLSFNTTPGALRSYEEFPNELASSIRSFITAHNNSQR